jgi:hypothetical protein
MTSGTTSPWRQRLKLVAFALTPFVVLFATAETLARLAITRHADVVVDDATGRRHYEFRMGKFPWSHASITPLNQDGFPDVSFDSVGPKLPGCRHLVFVGDSFTFGDGVDLDESYVSDVRRALARDSAARGCVRVFNLGRRATSVAQQRLALQRTMARLAPDAVVLTTYQNDLADLEFDTLPAAPAPSASPSAPTPPRRATWRPRMPAADVALVRWLTYVLAEGLTKAGVQVDLLARWSFLADPARTDEARRLKSAYEVRFDSLVTDLQRQGTRFGVVAMPSKFDLLAKRAPEVDYFIGLAKGRQLPTLSMYDVFDGRRAVYPFLSYDGHLNREGNRMVAEAIVAWLRTGEGASLLP